MGVKGLWNYIEHHGLLYQYPQVKGGDGAGASRLAYAVTPQHLLLDMNAVVHGSYSSRRPDTQATVEAMLASLSRVLSHFTPTKSLVLVFDGVSPCAKLAEQKKRRTGLSTAAVRRALEAEAPGGSQAGKSGSGDRDREGTVPLVQGEISCGSAFLLQCERCATEWARERLAGTAVSLHVVGSREEGEGEVKVARYIRQLWLAGLADGTYDPEDAFTIVGNDSDLFLVSVLAVPYQYFTLVDPDDLHLVAVKEVFDHWRNGVPNPPLPLELLPSYRVDFAYLMLLSGCDYYEGVPKDAVRLWRHYRDLRANHGFFRRGLVCAGWSPASDSTPPLDVELLRRVLENKGPLMAHYRGSKNKRQTVKASLRTNNDPHAVAAGLNVLRGALWSLHGYANGRCVDYRFRIDTSGNPTQLTIGCLRAAANANGLGRRLGSAVPASSPEHGPLFRPLEQYVAVLGSRGRYSAALASAIDETTGDRGKQLTTSTSVRFLSDTVRRVFEHVDESALSPDERELLSSVNSEAESMEGKPTFLSAAAIPPKAPRTDQPS